MPSISGGAADGYSLGRTQETFSHKNAVMIFARGSSWRKARVAIMLTYYTMVFYLASFVLTVALFPLIAAAESEGIGKPHRRGRQISFPSVIFIVGCLLGFLITFVLSDRMTNTFYDFFVVQTALVTTFLVWMSATGLTFAVWFLRKRALLLVIVMLAAAFFGLASPLTERGRQDVTALWEGPISKQGTIHDLRRVVARNEVIYTATINGQTYRIRAAWYQVLQKGDTVAFVHDWASRMVFPNDAISFSDAGRTVLLGLLPVWLCTGIVVALGLKQWVEFVCW